MRRLLQVAWTVSLAGGLAVAQTVQAAPEAPRPPEPFVPQWMTGAAQARPTAPESRRDCVVCHLEWADAFDRPGANLLIDRPTTPLVAEQQTCLGCHDGSVGDSRERVWAEHGHQTGIVPPPTMKVPEVLPLKDGKIDCRTCHTAHGGTGPQTIATIVFLRVQNESGQLCIACHTGMTKGPAAGTHTLGSMPWPIPQELLDAGALAGPAEYRLVCQTCHTAHGAQQEHLLVMGTKSSELCLTCHAKMRPGMFRPDVPREHPQNPPLENQTQREAIRAMGTQVGEGDTLICLSCHKVHTGLSGRFLLADTLHDSRLCIRCHPERDVMVGTQHDLRISAPESRNRLGLTPEQSGPCGACHSFHTFARLPNPVNGDPTGLCASCHQSEGPAAKKTGQPLSHPADVTMDEVPAGIPLQLYPPVGQAEPRTLACLTCHDPHLVRRGDFLRTETKDALCGTCHVEQALRLPPAHDFTDEEDLKNARGQTAEESGKCGFCHATHNANGPMMWSATKDSPDNADELCTTCHSEPGVGGARPVAKFSHPTGPDAPGSAATIPTDLPLYDAQGEPSKDGFVACGSCHDPHVSTQRSPHMLRQAHSPVGLCVACHRAQATMAEGPHDRATNPDAWPEDASEGNLCTSCHLPHSNDEARKLWSVVPDSRMPTTSDAVCVGCHTQQGWAQNLASPAEGELVHPRRIALPMDLGDLPVVPGQRREDPAIECKTCHDPHIERTSHLLRRTTAEEPSSRGTCFVCHPDSRFLDQSLHAAWVDPSLRSGEQACGPCHAVHATKGSMATDLWAAGLNPAGRDLSQQQCLACHGPDGPGKAVHVVQHPDVMVPPTQRIERIGPVGPRGIMPRDRITCITCHLPHGQMQPTMATATAPAAQIQPTLAALRASKPMVRMDVSATVCAMCHGFDAARKYLYYHKPEMRRSGVLPFVPTR